MARARRYHMLVSSLPALPTELVTDWPVMSEERLGLRLRMLEPEDAAEIARARAVLNLGHQFDEPDDAKIAARLETLMREIRNPTVREILEYGIDVRMIAVGLRCRRFGVDPPEHGIGRHAGRIRRQFKEPGFGLGGAFPRIAEAESLLANGELLELFRSFVLGATWTFLRRRAEQHYFDFEAVALYVARWDCLRRWQTLDAQKGREIFETLVTETLGEYANVYV